MFRYLERSENTARLLDAGLRMSLTSAGRVEDEWGSIITTVGARDAYDARFDTYSTESVTNFLLREQDHPSSVLSVIKQARDNARLVRTALTREVWEATNEAWMTLKGALSAPVTERQLPDTLSIIRQQSALVRAAAQGTMLRNEIYDFARLGTFLERADNTARILDVKYYVLLPSASFVGSSLDNVQWEMVLRSVSALRAYRWLNPGETSPATIADFLIFDQRMPRSLAFCSARVAESLNYLARDYGETEPSHGQADALLDGLTSKSVSAVFESGLHEFIEAFLRDSSQLSHQIETDYRFYG